MKLSAKDILNIDFLSKYIPSEFRKITPSKHFVFYYQKIESEGRLNILDESLEDNLNEAILRKMWDASTGGDSTLSYLGSFKEPFDTRNMLFYLYLKSLIYIEPNETLRMQNLQKLDALFLKYKLEDDAKIDVEHISKKIGNFKVISASTLEDALNHFMILREKVPSLIKVTEIVNTYFMRKHNAPIYSFLTDVVRAVKNVNGGLIPIYNGKFYYMLIGENSYLSKNNPSLIEAKELLRSEISMDIIKKKTGWYVGELDGRWRKRISDKEYSINRSRMTPFLLEGKYPFNVMQPSGVKATAEQVALLIMRQDKKKLLDMGYNVKISDFVTHEILFSHYPELKDVTAYLLFFDPKLREHVQSSCYHSSNPHHFMIFRQYDGEIENVLLHEMQHYIQSREGFANGGNDYIARIISAGGATNIRDWVNAMAMIKSGFCKKDTAFLSDKIGTIDFVEKVCQMTGLPDKCYQSLIKSLTIDDNYDCEGYIYSVINLIGLGDEATMRAIIDEYVNVGVFSKMEASLFAKIYKISNDATTIAKTLSKSGWQGYNERKDECGVRTKLSGEIQMLFFQYYRGLAGEMESRETQLSIAMAEGLLDYFYPMSSESMDKKYLTVFFEDQLYEDAPANATFGIEVSDGKYAMHLTQTTRIEPYLHELGHIVGFEIEKAGKYPVVGIEHEKHKNKYPLIDEFLVEAWLCYLCRKNFDEEITKSIINERKLLHATELDSIFDEMFFSKETTSLNMAEIEKAIEYLNKLTDEN